MPCLPWGTAALILLVFSHLSKRTLRAVGLNEPTRKGREGGPALLCVRRTSIAASRGGLLAPAATWGGFGGEDTSSLGVSTPRNPLCLLPLAFPAPQHCCGNKCSARVAYQRQRQARFSHNFFVSGDTFDSGPAPCSKGWNFESKVKYLCVFGGRGLPQKMSTNIAILSWIPSTILPMK